MRIIEIYLWRLHPFLILAINFFVLQVWVLDSTPGKVCPGGHRDDHPAELISLLRALPKEVSLGSSSCHIFFLLEDLTGRDH